MSTQDPHLSAFILECGWYSTIKAINLQNTVIFGSTKGAINFFKLLKIVNG